MYKKEYLPQLSDAIRVRCYEKFREMMSVKCKNEVALEMVLGSDFEKDINKHDDAVVNLLIKVFAELGATEKNIDIFPKEALDDEIGVIASKLALHNDCLIGIISLGNDFSISVFQETKWFSGPITHDVFKKIHHVAYAKGKRELDKCVDKIHHDMMYPYAHQLNFEEDTAITRAKKMLLGLTADSKRTVERAISRLYDEFHECSNEIIEYIDNDLFAADYLSEL